MREINETQRRFIVELALERKGLSDFVLEKDLFVLKTIAIVVGIENPYFTPVFCGGTCLAKAYQQIERMSEDIDFKILPTTAGQGLSKSATRKQLHHYVADIKNALIAAGVSPENIGQRSRDEHRYTELDVTFPSVFPADTALRPHLLVELNYNAGLLLPTVAKPLTSLLDAFARSSITPELTVTVACVALEEALAEKLVSFPRRLAKLMRGRPGMDDAALLSEDTGWDRALVRHLYDVYVIHRAMTTSPLEMKSLVASVIAKDQKDFKNQHIEFSENPGEELRRAMAFARNHPILQQQYDEFVRAMVYAEPATQPDYNAATTLFTDLIASVTQPTTDTSLISRRPYR